MTRRARLRFAVPAILGYLWLAKTVGLLVFAAALVVVADPSAAPTLKAVALAVAAALTLAWVYAVRPILPPRERRPDGVPLQESEAGSLIAETEAARRRVRGPRVRRIEVHADTVLAVTRGRRRTLVLGLPFLLALTTDELRALVAVGLAAEAPGGRLASVAVRLAGAWRARADAVSADALRRQALSRLVLPRLAARLEAAGAELDRCSVPKPIVAAGGSTETAASLLVKLELLHRYLDDVHWTSVWSRTDLDAAPPTDAFSSLRQPLTALGTYPAAEDWLKEAEPALAERLAALGAAPSLPANDSLTAGETLLGARLDEVVARVSERWRREVGETWASRHADGPASLDRLELRERHGLLDSAEVLQYATLVERYRGATDAMPLYERAVAALPDDAVAAYRLGRLLLVEGDDGGLDLLERAIALDVDATKPACELAADYLRATDRELEAEEYVARAERFETTLQAASHERQTARTGELLAHGLDADQLATVVATLEGFDDVERAYAARKDVRHLGDEWPAYLLGVVRRAPRLRPDRREANDRLSNRLFETVPLPGLCWIVTDTDDRVVSGWFRGIRDARIFSRPKPFWRRRRTKVAVGLALLAGFVALGATAEDQPPEPRTPVPGEALRAGDIVPLVLPLRLEPGDPIVALEWSFGDGGTVRQTSPTGSPPLLPKTTHVYEREGVYRVALRTVTKHGRTRTKTLSVEIRDR